MTCSSAPNLVCPQTKNGCGTLKLKCSRINQVSHYKASCKSVSVETGLDEMIAMVSERWLATHIPLLVLSCVPDIESQRLPCSDIVEKLNLASLNRPWQVSPKIAPPPPPRGGTPIFSDIRRLGSFFWVQNFEFLYF